MTRNGFTIIELIISIFIISVVIVGIFSAFSMVSILGSDSADRLTAAYLAQEGMEIVRNIRDSNWINYSAGGEAGWLDNLSGCEYGCEADFTTTGQLSQWVLPGRKLVLGDGHYLYDDTNLNQTKFKRIIFIKQLLDANGVSDHIAKVTVMVGWDRKPTIFGQGLKAEYFDPSNSVTTQETLYNWYNYASTQETPAQ